jgi:Domain of unknown function (DUF4402)
MNWGYSGHGAKQGLRGRAIRAALACVPMLLAASPALAAPEKATATGTAQAVVVERLSIIKVYDMDFGRIIPSTTAGTVVLAPTGARSVTGGTRIAGGPSQPATFAGFGANGQLVSLTMQSNTSTLTRSGGTQTMTMDTYIVGSTPTAQLTTNPTVFRINSATGMFQFPLGATLRVDANQTPGIYTGTFAVNITYF